MPRIDLHTHSTASDGTDTPAEIVQIAADAGLDVIALTDHDSTEGWAEATDALPAGLTLLPGLELSSYARIGEKSVSLHLLGYLVDPTDTALAAECAAIRDSRVHRAQHIVEAIAADGHPITWERVCELAGGTVGRPHIARALVEAGLVESVGAAFTEDWIGEPGRYYVPERKVPVLDAVAMVRAAGGVAVFAHPGADKRGEVVDDATIAAMADAGLAALEIEHPDHDAAATARLRGLAADLGLLVTGASDYHGANKTVRLGAFTTAPDVYEALVAQGRGSKPRTG